MNAKRRARFLNAGLALALAAMACNLPAGAGEPTATPAPSETSTPAPSATIDPSAGECIGTANRDANMRTGPGTDWDVIGQIAGGNSARITGHNGSRSWWQINDNAWVSAELLTTSGDCDDLLVAGFPPPPTKKAAGGGGGGSSSSSQPQPSNTPVSAPSVNLAFEVDYSITWFCGQAWRVSFIMYNQGNVPIESVYYSVEAPSGTYQNAGTVNNAPFEASAKETQPACDQPVPHGQSSLAAGQSGYIPINLNTVPPGVTEGFLYIEACTQNNRSGVCESQILFFNFTT